MAWMVELLSADMEVVATTPLPVRISEEIVFPQAEREMDVMGYRFVSEPLLFLEGSHHLSPSDYMRLSAQDHCPMCGRSR